MSTLLELLGAALLVAVLASVVAVATASGAPGASPGHGVPCYIPVMGQQFTKTPDGRAASLVFDSCTGAFDWVEIAPPGVSA